MRCATSSKSRAMSAVNCEFCNQRYVFDAVDIEQLFAAAGQPEVPQTRH